MGQPKPPPDIITQRLRLRTPRHSDATRLTELASDWDIVRMTSRMPHPYKRSDAEAYIDQVLAQTDPKARTLLVDHEQGGLAGAIGLFPSATGQPEIGYWIGKPFWGQGLATEAVSGLQAWASQALGLRYLTAGHFADNDPSGQVLIKTGFLYTGEVRTLYSNARKAEVPSRMMVWLA
jgi:RimJ/RimL family protein N-acetyltransferase